MKKKYLGLIFICLLQVIIVSGSHAKNVSSDEISIAVHRDAVTHMIKAALPMTLENGPYLKGTLWIYSIDHLKIGPDAVTFDINLRGKNMKFETQVGKNPLLMDIGNMDASFSCKATFRYDAPQRLLYITPYFVQKPDESKSDEIATKLLPLLLMANGVEYPLEIQKLEPIVTKISNDQFNIQMDITKIYTENDKIFVCGQARLKKIKGL